MVPYPRAGPLGTGSRNSASPGLMLCFALPLLLIWAQRPAGPVSIQLGPCPPSLLSSSRCEIPSQRSGRGVSVHLHGGGVAGSGQKVGRGPTSPQLRLGKHPPASSHSFQCSMTEPSTLEPRRSHSRAGPGGGWDQRQSAPHCVAPASPSLPHAQSSSSTFVQVSFWPHGGWAARSRPRTA